VGFFLNTVYNRITHSASLHPVSANWHCTFPTKKTKFCNAQA